MSRQNRTTLKSYFNTGARPTQEQFADLIDSSLNLADNGIFHKGGDLGLGHNNPASSLSVKGNLTVSPNNDSAPGNGLFVHGNVGIGAGFTAPTAQLAVKGSVYIGNTQNTDPGVNSLQVDGNVATGGDLSVTGELHATGNASMDGDLTLAHNQYVATDEVRARDGDGLKLYEARGKHGLIVHNTGNVSIGRPVADTHKLHIAGMLHATGDTSIDGNLTLAHNQYVATDEVRAQDSSGLKLHEAGGTGLLVHDSSGDVSADGNLTVSGSITAGSLSLTGEIETTEFNGHQVAQQGEKEVRQDEQEVQQDEQETEYEPYDINIPPNKVVVGLQVRRYINGGSNQVLYSFALQYK